ncbi:hypothetical protein [Blastococcus brunescens]|uniref:Uncharacterized protein n=1 Tax=Blastococcus brunescens TaxID=1564165 RepID=A0ABZ1B3H9_9ACTN|nr:hypothetical protein [Blastococcus sp. BMG 8361]WRL63904.1 hypothetical protein U6N30_30580 [Blastococcus sp. BMG 8361]
MNALLHEIIENGWIDREYIEAHTVGFAELEKQMTGYTPRWPRRSATSRRSRSGRRRASSARRNGCCRRCCRASTRRTRPRPPP